MHRAKILAILLLTCLFGCSDYDTVMPLGWSKSIPLASFAPSASQTLQAELSSTGGTATIQFEIMNRVGTSAIFPRARVSWTIGGGSVTRIISIGSGTSISGVGSNVKVEVYDACLEHFLVDPMNVSTYEVTVTISPGLRAPAQLAPTLIPWVWNHSAIEDHYTYGMSVPLTPAGWHSATADIPPNSGATSFYWTVGSGVAFPAIAQTDFRVIVFNATGILSITSFRESAGWLPLPAGASQIAVEMNPAWGGGGLNVSFILGIDG
jgi:hypothetical protein